MATYTVRAGGSLQDLATRFHTTVGRLERLNHLGASAALHTGEVLQVPDAFEAPQHDLERGQRGAGVKKLQDDLVKLGFLSKKDQATGPGVFGPHTEAAVKAFQKHAKVPKTGFYGPLTRKALAHALAAKTGKPSAPSQPSTPAPVQTAFEVPSAPAKAYAFFRDFVKQQGGTFHAAPGQMNLIGFRKNNKVGAGSGSYPDRLYAVWRDAQGHARVREFDYNTEPAASMRWDSSDVNGDGRNDAGRIPSGFYDYAISSRSNGAPCLRPTRDFKAERDTNQNGKFDESKRYWGGEAMLFHQGGYSGTGSAGCQTFRPDVWSSFWSLVRNAKGDIGYTLTTKIPKNV